MTDLKLDGRKELENVGHMLFPCFLATPKFWAKFSVYITFISPTFFITAYSFLWLPVLIILSLYLHSTAYLPIYSPHLRMNYSQSLPTYLTESKFYLYLSSLFFTYSSLLSSFIYLQKVCTIYSHYQCNRLRFYLLTKFLMPISINSHH